MWSRTACPASIRARPGTSSVSTTRWCDRRPGTTIAGAAALCRPPSAQQSKPAFDDREDHDRRALFDNRVELQLASKVIHEHKPPAIAPDRREEIMREGIADHQNVGAIGGRIR